MTKAPPILARVFRGPRVESAHRGSAAVVDERGALLASCGDAALPVYARSAAKPFQAMPLLLAGGEKRFRLTDEEIALLCASHGGEPRHTAVASQLLKKGGFAVSDLECGAHLPMHEPSSRALIRSGKPPTALHNNCSGKHAGMLLACRLLELPHAGYTDAAHPLQRRIRSLLARYAGVPESEIGVAVDGCNAPVFRLPLSALALAYARLTARAVAGEDRAAASARARLVRAIVRRPEMVAGSGRFTTDLVAAGRGRWVGKEGAEGVYAVALSPDGKGRSAGGARGAHALGIAFKIEDGSARARDAVTLALMSRLSVLPDDARRVLAVYAEPAVHNARGLDVGRIEADAPLVRSRAAAGKQKKR
ncbi:MAG TPA: asparaginase [Thermoanaerobaculia bacterium]